MHRISKLLAPLAAVVCLSPPLLADDATVFEGTWMHVGDPYGFVAGPVDAVEIGPAGDVTVRLFRVRSHEPECEADQSAGTCVNPQVTEYGTLMVEPVTRALRVGSLTTIPTFEHPMRQRDWEAIRFASEAPWSYSLDGDLLRLERREKVYGHDIELVKLYHRVDEEMPADLFDFLTAMELSITRAGCAVAAIQADPGMRGEFRALIADVAPIVRGGDDAAAREHLGWLLANPDASDAIFPVAVPVLSEIKACIDEFT